MRLLRRRTRKAEVAADATVQEGDPANGADGALRAQFDALWDREWSRLAQPGTWWTGHERVAIAGAARAAVQRGPETGNLSSVATAATRRIATAAATIRPIDVEQWAADGLDPFAYVEVVGIVSRVLALDVAAYGLGLDPRPLPEPLEGEPTFERPDGAAVTTGWAPTLGPATAPSSLSAVPPESEAMFDLHGVLYASMEQMFDLQLERDGLKRPQIELVAARTSRLNDCFY